MNRYAMVGLIASAVIILDRLSKAIVVRTLHLHESIPVIDGFFNLVYIRNRGIAFGILNSSDHSFGFYIQVPAVILAVLIIGWWLYKLPEANKHLLIGLALILGGAIGNLIDRFWYGEVVDFLDFRIGSYAWPSFNLADSAITLGALYLGLIFLLLKPSSSDEAKRVQHRAP